MSDRAPQKRRAATPLPGKGERMMVIEWLRFRLPEADHPRFIALDAQVWNPALARNPGYLGKEVWQAADDADELSLIIRWQNLAAWKAVPQALLDETDQAFTKAFGRAVPAAGCTAFTVATPALMPPA
jgi:uncharacterized protein (TIGR03792 family)